MSDSRSDAYEKLIRDDDDIQGMIAYAIFKRQKREFIEINALTSDHPAVKDYHRDLHEARVTSLRRDAEVKLLAYADSIG